jgi:signal transduction histidine kinase/HAMP domain-containing protein
MRRFGIPLRLYGMIALGGLGLAVSSALFIALLLHVSNTLAELHAQMRQHDQARLMQVNLKKQVQEWKDILLRGDRPEDLEAYRAAFDTQSKAVRASAEQLRRTARDPQTRELLSHFLVAHQAMQKRYDVALARFVAGRGLDPRAADAMVRGQDRGPTDLIDEILGRMAVLESVEAEVADIRREAFEIGLPVAGLLILLLVGSVLVSRSITRPIADTAQSLERIARGDLRHRVTIVGDDELTRMNRALNATVEAIQRTHAQLTEAVAAAETARTRLTILHEIDLAIIAETAPVAIAEAVLWRLRDLLGVPRAIVNLFDWTAGEVEWLAAVGRHRMRLGPGVRYPLSLAGDHDALRRGEPQRVEVAAQTGSPETAALLASGVSVYMVVPMIAGGELIGSISFGGDTAHFPDEQINIAKEVASQLAIALRQARLIEKVQASYEELKQTQAQLVQAQKMEAIGQLAGGVAHDFNNLLTVIGGRSSLLLQTMGPADPARRHVELIERTGQRAAGLTRQLLAFSRKQVLQARPVDLNTLLAGTMPMLRRLIGEDIEVVVVPGRDAGHVMADPGQIEQVIMNLVVNARDAIPGGGMVKIETATRTLRDASLHAHGQVPPGQYTVLSVQDTGSGIDPATLSKIFEPFFTTKEPGKGTGLGLSTVHGIVHQSDGYLAVDSTVGHGTTFTIYLPRIKDPVTAPEAPKGPSEDLLPGTATVLLVEDDAEVRALATEVLRTAGYTVLETGDPLEAILIGERPGTKIDLLLTDMILPAMRGPELAERFEAAHPGVRILYMSGYSDEIMAAATRYPTRVLLQKPFTPFELTQKVREVTTGS